jgi:hypothetical protein
LVGLKEEMERGREILGAKAFGKRKWLKRFNKRWI